jgi:hypothetical protein
LLLSIASLGLYVPFSVIPVEPETSHERTGVFRSPESVLRVEAEGHDPWSTRIVCGAQRGVSLRAVLQKP